jgi:hypothetical protein
MADEESGDERDRPRLGQLVKDLAGSREMMTSLTQALIPSLMEQLESGEGLNEQTEAGTKGDLARESGEF